MVSPQWDRHSEVKAVSEHICGGRHSACEDPRSGLLLRSRCSKFGSSEIEGGSCSRPALVRASEVSDLLAGRALHWSSCWCARCGGLISAEVTMLQALRDRVCREGREHRAGSRELPLSWHWSRWTEVRR